MQKKIIFPELKIKLSFLDSFIHSPDSYCVPITRNKQQVDMRMSSSGRWYSQGSRSHCLSQNADTVSDHVDISYLKVYLKAEGEPGAEVHDGETRLPKGDDKFFKK